MSFAYGLYISDDGLLAFAIPVSPAHFTLMGFTAAPVGTARQPRKLRTRKERFYNASGSELDLSYPTTAIPIPLGDNINWNGDFSYIAVLTLAESGTGEST